MVEGDGKGQLGWERRQRKVPRTGEEQRAGLRKPSKTVRCTLLNGSAWSTEKYMRRHRGTFDLSFAVEHRIGRGAVQQGGEARMEARSGRSKNHRRKCRQ